VLDEARRYLAAYTLEVELLARSGYANETILDVMAEQAYDLLFIGAYGHSRIIEMVLGSTTEYVLRNSPSPLFLCRSQRGGWYAPAARASRRAGSSCFLRDGGGGRGAPRGS